ncbi:hypothetical protein [Streptomyces sp. NPDC049555]|uniref:hypothetical protein n=1 Tax=Streptomyces sp. NPDC049555 TaxID=3154930 RepID=UPI003446723C
MRISSRLLVVGLAGSALAGGAFLLTGAANAADHTGAPTVADAPTEQLPSTVEDFSYPNAEKILKEKNLKLKRGNGKIILVECNSGPNLMRFIARDRQDFCFKATGNNGYLSLEVPSVGGVQSNDYNLKLTMTPAGDDKKPVPFDIPKNSWKGIGENADPAGREHTLIEITTSK